MKTLKTFLKEARERHWSTGHFNASELDQMRAVVEACKDIGSPAMIGASEGERKHLGILEAVALRDALAADYGIPVFLNADHSKSVQTAKEAIDVGFDSIHIDLSAHPFDENVAGTKEIVAYALAKGGEINVEGELGYLKGESKIQNEKIVVNPDDYTKPEEAVRFVKETGVNRLAIVVGNIHGISLEEPDLDIDRIREVRSVIPEDVAMVLHAGSGIPKDQIKAAIEAGIVNIHINTDLRVAFVRELRKNLADHLDEVAMYKLDSTAMNAMRDLIKDKLTLFGAVNRI